MAKVISRKKQRERRIRLRVAASLMDFLGVVASALLMILLVALLINLLTWLKDDMIQSFAALQKSVTEAILVD